MHSEFLAYLAKSLAKHERSEETVGNQSKLDRTLLRMDMIMTMNVITNSTQGGNNGRGGKSI